MSVVPWLWGWPFWSRLKYLNYRLSLSLFQAFMVPSAWSFTWTWTCMTKTWQYHQQLFATHLRNSSYSCSQNTLFLRSWVENNQHAWGKGCPETWFHPLLESASLSMKVHSFVRSFMETVSSTYYFPPLRAFNWISLWSSSVNGACLRWWSSQCNLRLLMRSMRLSWKLWYTASSWTWYYLCTQQSVGYTVNVVPF